MWGRAECTPTFLISNKWCCAQFPLLHTAHAPPPHLLFHGWAKWSEHLATIIDQAPIIHHGPAVRKWISLLWLGSPLVRPEKSSSGIGWSVCLGTKCLSSAWWIADRRGGGGGYRLASFRNKKWLRQRNNCKEGDLKRKVYNAQRHCAFTTWRKEIEKNAELLRAFGFEN